MPEFAAMSGTCRHPGLQVDTPAAGCHDGLAYTVESPPPPAPPFSSQPNATAPWQSFHTGSCFGSVTATPRFIEVPPTPVTSGSLAGESTASAVLPLACRQSSEPLSPVAAKIDCPCAAACVNSECSALRSLALSYFSQMPQLVDTVCALSSLTIADHTWMLPSSELGPS